MIQISEYNGEQMVDARELHSFLEVGRDFSNWIKDRIEKYRFVEGTDYVVLERSPDLANQNRGGDRRSKDYALTLDMAKSIAMVQNNEKGDEVRQYFISCEKKLNQIRKQMTPLEMHLETLRQMVEVERRTTQLENVVYKAVDEQNAKMQQLERVVGAMGDDFSVIKSASEMEGNFVTIVGHLSINGIKNKTREEIKILGMRVSKYCKENGIKIAHVPSVRHGKVNAYPRDVLDTLMGGLL